MKPTYQYHPATHYVCYSDEVQTSQSVNKVRTEMAIKMKATWQLFLDRCFHSLLSLASNHTLYGLYEALYLRTPPPQNLLTGFMIVK